MPVVAIFSFFVSIYHGNHRVRPEALRHAGKDYRLEVALSFAGRHDTGKLEASVKVKFINGLLEVSVERGEGPHPRINRVTTPGFRDLGEASFPGRKALILRLVVHGLVEVLNRHRRSTGGSELDHRITDVGAKGSRAVWNGRQLRWYARGQSAEKPAKKEPHG